MLFHLRNYHVTHKDLRCSCRGIQDVIPDPIRGLLVGSKRSIRVVKYADSNEHFWATIHQIVAPETGHVSHYRHKAFLDTMYQLFDCALFDRVSPNGAEHGPNPSAV